MKKSNKKKLLSFGVETFLFLQEAKTELKREHQRNLHEFARVNGLIELANAAILEKGEPAPIFWNARTEYPEWEIDREKFDKITLTGLLDTERDFIKIDTMFYYNRPNFKIIFSVENDKFKVTNVEIKS